MSLNGNDNEVKSINFDGDNYNIESLTPRVIEGLNMLVKLQNDIVELSYQLRKSQAAQIGITNEIKVNIKTDKIKVVEAVVEPVVKPESEELIGGVG